MAELDHAEKETIVSMLAQFRAPAEVASFFRSEYGITLSLQQIVKYDPTRSSFEAGDKWRSLFDCVRSRYLGDIAAVPIAHQAYRLNLLQEAVDAARRSRNWKLLCDLLEHGAKEVGGALTNERKLALNGNADPPLREMSSSDRAALLGRIVADALARRN